MFRPVRIFLATAALAVTTFATPITVTRTHFSATFPDGWMELPLAIDSVASVMGVASQATGTIFLTSRSEVVDTAALIAAFSDSAAMRGYFRDSIGTRKLGPHTFFYAEGHDTTATGPAANSRSRVYVCSENGFTFIAILSYMTNAPKGLTDFETALATLTFSGTAGLRPVARAGMHKTPAMEPRDILGRLPATVTSGLPPTALFFRE